MARYWVGETADRRVRTADRPAAPDGPSRSQVATGRRERVTDAVRRTLAGNVRADDAGE